MTFSSLIKIGMETHIIREFAAREQLAIEWVNAGSSWGSLDPNTGKEYLEGNMYWTVDYVVFFQVLRCFFLLKTTYIKF